MRRSGEHLRSIEYGEDIVYTLTKVGENHRKVNLWGVTTLYKQIVVAALMAVINIRKKTHEEYVEELALKNPTVICRDTYLDANIKIAHLCLIHNELWEVKPSSVLRGAGCPKCHAERSSATRQKSSQQYQTEVARITSSIIPIEEYKGARTPILHRCIKHNVEWKALPGNILQGCGCAECAKEKIIQKNTKPHEQYIHELKEKCPGIICIEDYQGAEVPILHQCLKMGHKFLSRPADKLSGKGCPKCSGTYQMTNDEFVMKLHTVNPDIEPLDPYVTMKTPIRYRCKKDGYVWEAIPNSVIHGSGCPQCNESSGERKIRQWLERHHLDFIFQKKYDDCKDKECLPFDFYVPSFDVLIEFDGAQHFRAVELFGGEQGFKVRKKHDEIKNAYCEQNHISLLRISFQDNIEEKLQQHLLI